jgi:hypothetical protein
MLTNRLDLERWALESFLRRTTQAMNARKAALKARPRLATMDGKLVIDPRHQRTTSLGANP